MKMAIKWGQAKTKKAATKKATPAARMARAGLVSRIPAHPIGLAEASVLGLERQADDVVERILRGEHNAARLLASAPAAGDQVPASRGLPLAAELREELERGFGANLEAVRVHTDVPAADAAAARRAQAFTSGRDIYFAAGKFHWQDDGGKQLLYHETAHVLQQTGRVSTERLRATEVTGNGPIQRKSEGKAYRQRRALSFDGLVDLHTAETPDDELKRMIELVGDLLEQNLDNEVEAEALEKKIMANERDFKTKSARARSFLFDVMKLTDRWEGACWLLDQDLLLQTAAPVTIVVEDGKQQSRFALTEYYIQHQKGEAWFNQVASTHSLLREFWPKTFLDNIWNFLMGPGLENQPLNSKRDKPFQPDLGLERLGDFSTAKEAFSLTWLGNKTSPKDNELVITALTWLDWLEDERQKKVFPKIKSEIDNLTRTAKQDVGQLALQKAVALKIAEWGDSLQKRDYRPGINHPLGEKIVELAKKAFGIWEKVEAIQGVVFSADQLADAKKAFPGAVVRLAQARPTVAAELPRALMKANTIFFGLTHDGAHSIPDSKAYLQQIRSAKAILLEFAGTRLEKPLLELFRKEKMDENQMLVDAWFLEKVYSYVLFLDSYDAAKDNAFVGSWKSPDIRLAHRLQAARKLDALAGWLSDRGMPDWNNLHEQLTNVLTHKDQNHSALALLGDWKPQAGINISQLSAEFPKPITVQIRNPLTKTSLGTMEVASKTLANLYTLIYYRDIAGRIQNLLNIATQNQKDPEQALQEKTILETAFSEAGENSRPVRFGLAPFEYARNDAESQNLTDADGTAVTIERDKAFYFLMANHPKTVQAQALEAGRGRDIIAPDMGEGEVYFWSVPSVFSMILGLRMDGAGLNEVIASALEITVEEVKSWRDPLQWFEKLINLPDSVISAEVKRVQQNQLIPNVRSAVNYERRLIARLIRQKLPDYKARVTQSAPGTYDLPVNLLQLIERFAGWVSPPGDRYPQMAALFLSVAPALKEAFTNPDHPEQRTRLLSDYLGHILLAMKYATGEFQTELRRVADPAELTDLLNNQAVLQQVHDVMSANLMAAIQSLQLRFGFESTDGKSLSSPRYTNPVEAKKAFQLEGDWFNVLEVVKRFEYHPAVGARPSSEAPLDTGYVPASLKVEGTNAEVGERGSPNTLFVVTINGREFKVSAQNTDLLDRMAYVVEMRANLIGLENLEQLIEESTALAMDAAEFIPGAGQAVAAARIVTTIMQFMASGEFQDLLEAFTKDPWEMIKKAGVELSERITPEGMWDFLMFDNPLFRFLMKAPDKKKKSPGASGGNGSRLAKIKAKLQGIWIGLGKAMKWLHGKVQLPLNYFEATVQAHPSLALVISWIADHIFEIADFLKDAPDLKTKLQNWFQEGQDLFYARLQGLLDGLAGLQLPKNVLPIKEAAGAVIDLILRRFKTKGKIIAILLEKTGAMNELTGMIEKQIVDSEFNPNKIWMDEIRPPIQKKFATVRDALSDKTFDILHDDLGLKVKKPDSTREEDVAPSFEGDDGFDVGEDELHGEVQGYQATAPDAAAVAALPAPGGGQPLDSALRARAENRFGQDFGHVRLHHGTDARQATEAFGAQGLASGSHVFLRHDLTPTDGKGEQVFHHELTHVLQQTGARPLGGNYSAAPRPGKPGAGLRVDAAQEAAADQAAGLGGGGAQIGAFSGDLQVGVQPSGLSLRIMRRLFNDLSNVESAQERRQDIEKRIETEKNKGKKVADVPADELQIATNLYNDVEKRLSEFGSVSLPKIPALSDVKDLLKEYLTSQLAEHIKPSVSFIAYAALVTKRKPKDAPEDQEPPRELDVEKYAKFLQQYIMAMTGVVVNISLKDLPKDRSALSSGAWVSKVEITNLLLWMLSSATETSPGKIWTKAMSSFPNAASDTARRRKLIRDTLREAGATRWVRNSGQDGSPGVVDIWDNKNFAFHADFVKYITEREKQIFTVTKAELPPFRTYVDHARKESGPVIGVRIGQYKDKNQKGADRESHHTTQWLLVDYFRNRTNPPAFRPEYKKVWKVLGIDWDNAGPMMFKHPTREKAVEFAALDNGRGDEMPAILLATSTHRDHRLHVGSAKPEDWGGKDVNSRPTQSGWLHNAFKDEMQKNEILKTYAQAKKADPDGFLQAVQGKEKEIQDVIYAALQTTYQEMYQSMMLGLQEVLPDKELKYYETIAEIEDPKKNAGEALGGTQANRKDKLTEVARKAKSNNNEVMRKYGWVEKG